jgi:hypothetical protein
MWAWAVAQSLQCVWDYRESGHALFTVTTTLWTDISTLIADNRYGCS